MVVKTLLHNSTLCSAELPGTWLSICMLSVISLIQIWGEISDFDRPHLGDYSRHSYQLGCEFKSRSAKFEYKHFMSYYFFFGKFVLCFSMCQLAKEPKKPNIFIVCDFPNPDLILFVDLVNCGRKVKIWLRDAWQ